MKFLLMTLLLASTHGLAPLAPRRQLSRTSVVTMGGFGAKKTTEKKSFTCGKGVKVQRSQYESFAALKKTGAAEFEVHVRAGGGSPTAWVKAGCVVSEGDATEAAIQYQRQLIIAHGLAMTPGLKTRKPTELELGWRPVTEEEGDEGMATAGKVSLSEDVKCGFREEVLNTGPFYKRTDQFGLSDRIDTTSNAGGAVKGGEGGASQNAGGAGRGA